MGRYTFCIYCKLAVTISSYSFYFPTENSGHRRRTGGTREQRRHGWSGTASSISNLARQVLKCREEERGGAGTIAGQLRHKQEELKLHFGKM